MNKQLISPGYKDLNRQLHEAKGVKFGHRGHIHIPVIRDLIRDFHCQSVLDYGCGKGTLSKEADFSVVNYDPAVSGFENDPPECDLVVCTDVLEHIEPDLLDNVLHHIHQKMNKAGYLVINTREDRSKSLPDGSNPHKIIQPHDWWLMKLKEIFYVSRTERRGHHLQAVVRPVRKAPRV